MRYQTAKQLAARLRIFDVQCNVRAEIGRRPQPEHGRLDLVQVEHRRLRRRIRVAGFLAGQHGGILSSGEQLDPSERQLRLSNLVEKFIDGLA
jgi:hypothetical protein